MTTQSPDNPTPVRRRRPPPRVVEVRGVTRVTPRMVRITFGGEQLDGFNSKGPAEHVRIFLPNSETGELLLPEPGPEGNEFPEGMRPASRAYTPRRWDAAANELVVDIALHEQRPRSRLGSRASRKATWQSSVGRLAGPTSRTQMQTGTSSEGTRLHCRRSAHSWRRCPSTTTRLCLRRSGRCSRGAGTLLRCALRSHMAAPRGRSNAWPGAGRGHEDGGPA